MDKSIPDHILQSKMLRQESPAYGQAASYNLDYSSKQLYNIQTAINKINKSQIRIKNVLDYGCGQGGLVTLLKKSLFPYIMVTGYDPATKDFSQKPSQKFDLVTCIDVLEHIDRDSIESILLDIKKNCNSLFFYSIDLLPAKKSFQDGRNAHILLAPPDWWIQKLSSIFALNINFVVGKNTKGVSMPSHLIGCSSSEIGMLDICSEFLFETKLTTKEWIMQDGHSFRTVELKDSH